MASESSRWKDAARLFLKNETFELAVINEEPNETIYEQADSEISEAVLHFDLIRLKTLINGVEPRKRANVLHSASVNGRPLLNYTAVNGYSEMVRFLLDNGVDPLKSVTKTSGRTALHEAIRAGFPEVVAILVQRAASRDETDGLSVNRSSIDLALGSLATLDRTGMLVNAKDQVGLTPILILAEAPSLSVEQFTSMVTILTEHGANVKFQHPANGQTVLFRAVELHAEEACNELVTAGASVDIQDIVGDTVVHLAARLDLPEILRFFLQCSRKSVNQKNKRGETPLHCASTGGSRECLKALLDFGADLSIEDSDSQTAIDAVFSCLPRPSSFLLETLDSKIMANEFAINDRRFQLTLDFRVLSPDQSRQMAVVVALMNTLRQLDRKRVLAHPLIETYLRAKWRRMRIFFFGLVFIHFLFVVSLSNHVIWNLYPKEQGGVTKQKLHRPSQIRQPSVSDNNRVLWSRRVLLATASILMCHLTMQTLMAPRYFLLEAETWLSLTCVCLSFTVSLGGELIQKAGDAEWMRHVAAVTVLLAWGQVMFILGRLPTVGFFALMFFTVLKNVVKVLLITLCLVFGFALSFCIQFNYFEYEGTGMAFLRTTVMLMGEYNYENLFPVQVNANTRRWEDKPSHLYVTSHIIFLLFILLGSVVLVNLLIGLAVSDIQGLQAEGNLRHMIKQAEFMFHMDVILSCSKYFKRGKTSPVMVTLSPNSSSKMRKVHYRMLGLSIPCGVLERLVTIALRNQKRGSDASETIPPAYLSECNVHISD